MTATIPPYSMRGTRGLAPFVVMLMLSMAFAGCLESLSLNSAPTAKMSVDPDGAVRAGDSLTFSAVGSSDPDADALTFSWNFGDGNVGNGLTTSHTYSQPGDYGATLTVSDGTYEATATKVITVVDASARVVLNEYIRRPRPSGPSGMKLRPPSRPQGTSSPRSPSSRT